MLQEITHQNIDRIREPVFRSYAWMYLDIYDAFLAEVERFGLPFCRDGNSARESALLLEKLRAHPSVYARGDGASLVYKRLSPACEACRTGLGSITSHISFQCHRNCFFCFNPNQENYETHMQEKNDWRRELAECRRAGGSFTHIALTGGEPLLHGEECAAFFRLARQLYPKAHLRLYTSGDLLTEKLAEQLAQAGLDEIRFSYKMEDAPSLQETVLSNMAMAKAYIPSVMVEMPVMPDCEAGMRELLLRLDELGIWGINLLELCFPYRNAEAFRARAYSLRYPPYRTLYNFWYAGGLPVDGSETAALRLLLLAAEKELSLGVHYCSLENKNFGQIYQQNSLSGAYHPSFYFSERDYYLKTVKAFGEDARRVAALFQKRGVTRVLYNREAGFIQFHPEEARHLRNRAIELALSVNVREQRDGEFITRELKLLRAEVHDCLSEGL